MQCHICIVLYPYINSAGHQKKQQKTEPIILQSVAFVLSITHFWWVRKCVSKMLGCMRINLVLFTATDFYSRSKCRIFFSSLYLLNLIPFFDIFIVYVMRRWNYIFMWWKKKKRSDNNEEWWLWCTILFNLSINSEAVNLFAFNLRTCIYRAFR